MSLPPSDFIVSLTKNRILVWKLFFLQSFDSTTAEKSPSSLTLISVQVTFFPGKNQKHLFVPSVLNDQRWASDRSLCRHCPKLLMSHFCPATHVFPFWEIILNYFNDFFKPFSLCFLSHPLAWSANVLYFTSLFCIFLLCVLGIVLQPFHPSLSSPCHALPFCGLGFMVPVTFSQHPALV